MCWRSGIRDFCIVSLFRSRCKPLWGSALEFALRRIFYFRVQKSRLLHVALRATLEYFLLKAAIGGAKVSDLTSFLDD
jgi:hypothetical protein